MTQSVHGIFWEQSLFRTVKEAPVLYLVSTNKNDGMCKQKVHSAIEIVKDHRKAVGSNTNMKVKKQESDG